MDDDLRSSRTLAVFDYVVLLILVCGLGYIAYKVLTHG